MGRSAMAGNAALLADAGQVVVRLADGRLAVQVDLEFPGPIPFAWERKWYSNSEYAGPLGSGWHHAYDAALLTDAETVAVRLSDELRYDQHHNLTRVHTPDGHTRALAYDGLGRLLTLTDALGHTERRYYDLLGQLTGVQDRDGSQSCLRYDGDGNIVYAQDAQQTVEMRYNGVGQLASRQQAGATTTFTYDSEGRLTGLTNGHNQHYHFVLDLAGRVLEEHGFDGQIRRYEYDRRVYQPRPPGPSWRWGLARLRSRPAHPTRRARPERGQRHPGQKAVAGWAHARHPWLREK